MEDEKIIGLYWERNEDAITETSSKYGKLFFRIASNILLNHEDSEECVNDTYLGLWNAIPKERPSPFSVFASRITRNLALKKYEYLSAEKRKPEAICSFEELGDCVSGKEYVESEAENRRIEQLIDTFLCQIGEEKRNIFYADTGICYGFYCLYLIFNTFLEDVSSNVDAMNESNLPLYILFFVIAMHSISITLIYRVLRPAE